MKNLKTPRILALAVLFGALTGFMGMCEKKDETGAAPQEQEQPVEGDHSMDDHSDPQ